jgi:PKD repeat protein
MFVALLSSCGGGGGGGGGIPPASSNQPPMAQAAADVTVGEAPLVVAFGADGSSDPDGDELEFVWDFGDASPPAAGESVAHTFSSPGRYLAVLTVTDSQGLSSVSEVIIDVSVQDCPSFAPGIAAGQVESDSIVEASGLVASRRNPGVLWVNNDSGDAARVFAMSTAGTHLGTFNVAGANAYDWEDIAIGPGPQVDADYLYIADIGDNARARSHVSVYRVLEPQVSVAQAPVTVSVAGAERLDMAYPDGAWDAESMFVDPLAGDLYIVSKRSDGRSRVYRHPAPHAAGSLATMEIVATLALGSGATPGSTLATAADIAPSGRWLIVRTYSHAFLWRRPPGASVGEAFATEVCRAPIVSEPQGEAICFAADESGYFTVSEGSHPPLHFFDRTVAP